jgi:peptidoglycan/xylan/chitin deacetylase (PgdA/CDA1 family)
MRRTGWREKLVGALLVVCVGTSSAYAQTCDPAARPPAIELAPGQNVGVLTEGFTSPAIRRGEVVLTFDDGPSLKTTRAILDILKKRCLAATFFPLGDRAAEHSDLVKRELAEGHAIGGHTWDHPDLADLPLSDATEEILHGFEPIKSAGVSARLFRFPKLSSSPELLAWLGGRGYSVVGADIDPWDWAVDPPADTLARIKEGLAEKGGGIILLHDDQPNTVQLLPDLLDFLDSEGYRVVLLRAAATGAGSG